MQTLTRGRYRATLKPTRNVGEFSALLDKCNGKHKPSKIKGETRKYPAFEAGMSTQRYVRLYENMQRGMVAGFYDHDKLNRKSCMLYMGEDTFEIVTDCWDDVGGMAA